jgi:hypothetical protein
MKPQPVWYESTRREDSTPVVLEPSDLFGRESEPLQPPDLENVHEV